MYRQYQEMLGRGFRSICYSPYNSPASFIKRMRTWKSWNRWSPIIWSNRLDRPSLDCKPLTPNYFHRAVCTGGHNLWFTRLLTAAFFQYSTYPKSKCRNSETIQIFHSVEFQALPKTFGPKWLNEVTTIVKDRMQIGVFRVSRCDTVHHVRCLTGANNRLIKQINN